MINQSGHSNNALALNKPVTRRLFLYISGAVLLSLALTSILCAHPHTHQSNTAAADGSALPLIHSVELQPLAAQTRRLIGALDYLGAPLAAADRQALAAVLQEMDPAKTDMAIQRILDPYCLVQVNINPESRVKVIRGPAKGELIESGWRQFLVKVHNEAGTTAELRNLSPHAQSVFSPEDPRYTNASDKEFAGSESSTLPNLDRWLDMQLYNGQSLIPTLSGLPLEYRIVQLYSRDAGAREATLIFHVGQGTQDLGFRSELPILFDCRPAYPITLRVRDENRRPTTAASLVRDAQGQVYPSQAKRLAPDFPFQPQIYRSEGETLKLPAGAYTVKFWRGPESIPEERKLTVSDRAELEFQVRRWIDPSEFGWWSGDTHIHPAGCAHYISPTEGVTAQDLMRHTLGEDLKIGSILIWAGAFDHQKQFFTGQDDSASRPPYLIHYDMEVSGFGSYISGHLVLLGLKDLMYPGGDSTHHWPTLCLNTLRWAKKQGAIVGYAHSGLGLTQQGTQLPTYEVPKFDNGGANEYIVDVTHMIDDPDGVLVPAVDFLSVVDTPPVWELNIWYHTLNAGYRTRIAGETDFPCIYGSRVGMGRSYVKLDDKINYQKWCQGLQQGCAYVSEGKSHLMDFTANDLNVGESGSELRLNASQKIALTVKAAALLDDTPDPALHDLPPPADIGNTPGDKAFWHIERARIGDSREVPVEVIVNGYPVARQTLVADGVVRELEFEVLIERSSWVALRIFPSSHTNPFFVLVDDKPIRASRRSLEWCLKGVDQCWSQKAPSIKLEEQVQAQADYEHARQAYRQRLSECDTE